MRDFIVLCLLSSIVYADKLGYNYKPVPHSDNGLSFAPGAVFSAGLTLDVNAPAAAPLFSVPSTSSSTAGSFSSHSSSSYSAPIVELEKEFYTFSANEADFDDGNAAQRIAGAVKQGLRVIFIKGPENKGFEEAALALANQAAQQKTAIYVLNKHTDIGDLATKLNAAAGKTNVRPEVHFVKYRTPEDAANAQKAIQSQYDSLGGKSQSFNGGVAPVINFASQAVSHTVAAPQQPHSGYLPSSIFRRRV